MLQQLVKSIVEGYQGQRDIQSFGDLVFLKNPDNDLKWINQTVCVGPNCLDQIDSLLDANKAANREVWLEIIPDLCPGLTDALEAKGLVCHGSFPVLILPKSEFVPEERDGLARAYQDSDYDSMQEALASAFGKAFGTKDSMKETPTKLISVREHEGRIVSAGQAIGPATVKEVAGIGTHAEFRKQGHAQAVVRNLCSRFFANGGELAWLAAADLAASSVYQRCGFRVVSNQVAYGFPEQK